MNSGLSLSLCEPKVRKNDNHEGVNGYKNSWHPSRPGSLGWSAFLQTDC